MKNPPDFAAFREALAVSLSLGARERASVANVAASSPYRISELLAIEPADIARAIARFLSLPFVAHIRPDEVRHDVLPGSFCRTNSVVTIERDGQLIFVLGNPFDWTLLQSLENFVRPGESGARAVAAPATISAALNDPTGESRGDGGGDAQPISRIVDELEKRYQSEESAHVFHEMGEESEPLVLLINKLIESAHALEASDIHIEPWEDRVVVRFRLDGELRVMYRLRPRTLIRPLVSRIKVMSGLDISEKRLPQDGRISVKEFVPNAADFDLRVSTAPMNFGEKVVLRIVDKEKSVLPLDRLGFSEHNLRLYREHIRSPYGMVLHVGPTGSGKSMTLYAALNEMKSPAINIQTIEDPIEYTLPGINQMQIRPSAGLTFQRALRAFLRQDPDVILVGEIRDRETAEIAVEAALTGHLLLSTLHTNDAASTITRFIQMGVEPFMVSSSIVLICAQRLLRRLCPQCRVPFEPSIEERRAARLPEDGPARLYRPGSCAACNGIGYRGRIGTHEVLIPNDALRMAVTEKGVTAERLKRLAVECGDMVTLYEDAMEKVREGSTSIDEVVAKVRRDEFDARPQWLRDALAQRADMARALTDD